MLAPVRAFARLAGAVTVVVAVVALASPAWAQNGTITGYVTDPDGVGVPGVVVTAESPDFLGTRTSFTNAQGYYRLLNLPPGTCTVIAEIAGFRTIETEVVMRAGAGFRLDMSLQLGGIEETVTVSGASPMLDISKPGQVFTIDGDFQRAVPVTGRKNWSDFLELTPGVNARPFDDGSGRMVYFGHGTEHFAHVIQLEGQTGTGYRDSQVTYVQMSTEMIADIEVRSGGVGADQPIGTGLIMNIVTKSGGNQLAGTLGYTYQPLSWNGDNDPDKTSPSTPSINKVSQADFSIGGPIKKDAVWFFGAGRFSRNETGISRTPEDVQRQLDFDPSWTPFNNIYEGFFPYLKLSATTGKTLLNGYYQHDKVDISGMREYHGKRLGTRQTGGSLFGLKASTIFNENASLELVASYNNKTSAYQSFDALTDFGLSGPEITVHESIRLVSGRARGSGRLVETGNLESITVGPSTYRLFRGDLSYFTGSHDLKTGFFAAPKMTRNDSRFYLNDGFIVEEVVYIDANNPALGTRWFHRRFRTPTSLTLLAQEDRDIGLYLQDAWNVSDRLTITGGLRVDFIKRQDLLFGITKMKDTAVGPRLGFTYMLNASGTTVLRGSLSRVHEQVNGRDYGTSRSAGSTESSTTTDVYDNNGDGIIDVTRVSLGRDASVADFAFAKDLRQPYVDEAIIGIRRQLGRDVAMDLGFVHRQQHERYADYDINGFWPFGNPGTPFGGWGATDPTRGRMNQIRNNTWDKLVYNALEFTITKRLSDSWQLMASVNRQWHHLAGTWNPTDPAGYIEPDKYENRKCIWMPRGRRDDNSYQGGSNGTYCPTWRNYSIRTGGTWLGPGGLTVGATFMIQDGPWSGAIMTRAAYDPRFGPETVVSSTGLERDNPLATDVRFKFATRNIGQEKLPDIKYFNLAIGKRFDFGRRSFELRGNILNVFNWGNFQQYTYSGASQDFNPNFLQGRSMQTPRAFQLYGVLRF